MVWLSSSVISSFVHAICSAAVCSEWWRGRDVEGTVVVPLWGRPTKWTLVWIDWQLSDRPAGGLSGTELTGYKADDSVMCIGLTDWLTDCYPSMPMSSHLSLSCTFSHKNRMWISSPRNFYIPCPFHSSRFDYPNNIVWAVQIIKQYRSLSSTHH